ncbi:MAG: STAS domain-containing protein [Maioricimonas sp. JB049]
MTGHTVHIEVFPEFRALLLQLNESQLGSLETDSLRRLADSLQSLPDHLPGDHVVVDLSGVRHYGAALLTLLVKLKHHFEQSGRELVVAGDPLGLIRFSGIPVASFESIGVALYAVSQRGPVLAPATC